MKARTLGIVAAASLAALVSGNINADEGYPTIVRSELLGGYIVSRIINAQGEEDLRLIHLCGNVEDETGNSSQYCFDKLRVWRQDSSPSGDIYEDFHSDGTVDKIITREYYLRGEPGTEGLFAQADVDFARYKQELGLQ